MAQVVSSSAVKPRLDSRRGLAFYKALVLPRLIEEKMLLLLRQGKITKWFSGIGQEGIAVGATLALEPDEYILPLHRNLGVFTTRNVPLARLFSQFQGTMSGFTKGRDRSFHFGTNEYHIVGMISHLGPQLGVADGIALAHKLSREQKVTLVFTGEGGTSEGDFHEALNVAATWDLPVIFLIENNGYALSTPVNEQYRCERLSDRAKGYGMKGITIDGNDLLEVYDTVDACARNMRKNPAPVLIECLTFRMRGHEEASGTKYVPKHLFKEWAERDPVLRYENFLDRTGIVSRADREGSRAELQLEIDNAIEQAFSESLITASVAQEISDVYAPWERRPVAVQNQRTKRRFIDAISDGLAEALQRHSNLILMGQDIGDYGGVFKVTEGFLERFGAERIRNTPLCESAIVGAALGLSVAGYKSIVEMQFADFVSCGFNQIVNNLAKIHWRWGQSADVVIRMPTGAGSQAGPFHSQSDEAWFFHTPGLKIVYPSSPIDAKGLLLSAIEDPNPYLFFEHKVLYRSVQEEVPDGYFNLPIGEAKVLSEGSDVCVLTYGMGVHWAQEVLRKHSDISAYVVDLRTLLPLDYKTIREAVSATGRVLIVHEDTLLGGIGAELGAWIGEHCFEMLDAPVVRCASLDTPVPFAGPLEQQFLAKNRLESQLLSLLSY